MHQAQFHALYFYIVALSKTPIGEQLGEDVSFALHVGVGRESPDHNAIMPNAVWIGRRLFEYDMTDMADLVVVPHADVDRRKFVFIGHVRFQFCRSDCRRALRL